MQQIPGMVLRNCKVLVASAAAVLAANLSSAAMAEEATRTWLVTCGDESCLIVAGRRESSESVVSINGHPVDVEGKRSWQARLPLASVRAWSEPYARNISVKVIHTDGITESANDARLPIGLLGHVQNLDKLVVAVR